MADSLISRTNHPAALLRGIDPARPAPPPAGGREVQGHGRGVCLVSPASQPERPACRGLL